MRPRALQICHFLRGYFGPKNRSRGHRLVSFCGGSGAGAPCFCIKKHRRPFKNEANANICQPSSTENDEHIQKWLWIKTTYALFGSIWGGSIHAFSSYFGVNTEHWGPCRNIPTHPMCPIWSVPLFLAPWDPESLSYWIPSWPHADARCDGVLTGGSLKLQWYRRIMKKDLTQNWIFSFFSK